MSDQTIHNVTSHDWVIIEWIGEHRTVSASAMTWLEWHEELLELRDERDALAKRLAVKCEHPNTEQCCKLWEADTARRQLEGVDAKLAEEFDWGCDTVEHLATALVAARAERDALAAEIATIRRRWNHVAGLAQTMGLKMDGQNSWRFRPLYNGRGPTIEAAVDDAIEEAEKARDA